MLSRVIACYSDGEASLAVRKELAAGPVTVSLVGYSMNYNTLDNNKSPTSGLFAQLKNDFAGVGGDVNFIRTTAEMRDYYEVLPDVVGVLKLQGGHVGAWGGKDLRMLDHFQMGPNLVRGFAPNGIGPRDLTPGTSNDALGGTMYWGASVEFQTPLYFLPKEIGIKFATFADAGSVVELSGADKLGRDRRNVAGRSRQRQHDPFVGRCRPDLGFAAGSAALRRSLSADEILRYADDRWRRGV